MKKLISIAIGLILALSCYCVFADEINIGTYIQLGHYNGEPIVWKCADIDDENGVLMLSDKILCYKAYDIGETKTGVIVDRSRHTEFGGGFWEESQIRAWLNAKETGGNIIWPSGYAPTKVWNSDDSLRYDQEDGFISSTNFTNSELSVMKTVEQWQLLITADIDMSTNGVKHAFQGNALRYDGRSGTGFLYSDVTKLSHIEGGMYRVCDTIFLLDVRQIYKLWSNFGTVAATAVDGAYQDDASYTQFGADKIYRYCLRTQAGQGTITYVYGDTGYDSHIAGCAYGIRPAFYLNDKNAQIISGSGTEEDPYVVDSKFTQYSTAVFSQGEQVGFEQEPIEYNDCLYVQADAIFESLGAEMTYDDGDGVIVANNDERTVVMQIDNDQMGNGTDVFTLEAVPEMIGDEVMIPLSSIADAYDCSVAYLEDLNRVVIDKPALPMDFGEGVGREDWQQDWYKENFENTDE